MEVPPNRAARETRQDSTEPPELTAFDNQSAGLEKLAPNEFENSSINGQIGGLEDEQNEYRLLRQRVALLTAQVGSLHFELSEHLEEQARAQKRIGVLEEELRETRKALTQKTADLAEQKSSAAAAGLEKALALATALEQEVTANKAENEALRRNNAEAENQLAVVNAQLMKMRNALAEETASRQNVERKLTSTEQDRSEFERRKTLEICQLESAIKAKEVELKHAEVLRAQMLAKR